MLSRAVVAALLLTLLLVLTACAAEAPQASGPEYLGQDIPPCTPVEGSTREPCGSTIPMGGRWLLLPCPP